MADVSKAQKLASARKKFKELKKERRKNTTPTANEHAESTSTSREQTPVENVTNVVAQEATEGTPLTNYFSNVAYSNGYQQSDIEYQPPVVNNGFQQQAISNEYQQPVSSEYLQQTVINENQPPTVEPVVNSEYQPQSVSTDYQQPVVNEYQQPVVNNEYQQPVVNESVVKNETQQPAAFFDTFLQNIGEPSSQPTFMSSYFGGENYANTEKIEELQESEIKLEPVEDKISQEKLDFQAYDTVKFGQNPPETSELSSVESLRQLSEEMAELINPSSESPEKAFQTQLEIRNQQLAALLGQEKQKTEVLEANLEEYQKRLTQSESKVKELELTTNTRVETEMSRLREELQYHVQTVGILVAEKAELVANLNQFQLIAKQKTSECEELQGRLKTSRSRVADLEREIVILKNEKSQFDNIGKEHNIEFENLKTKHQKLQEERDELMQDLLEVREKLKTSSETNLSFQQQIAELSNQLSMANIKIQQLTTGELDQHSSQVEQLTQEKFNLEKHIADLNNTVKTLSKEREESSLQYQQYAQQLNAQLSNMASRLEKLQKENESLSIQEQNRIKHIGELEKQLQILQNDQVTFAHQRTSTESRAELDAAIGAVEKLKIQNTELQEENIKVLNEKELLEKDLESKRETIRELEEILEEFKSNQPDNAKLLATMESDKVAAARAVSQNTELKNQMESMQEVFMKLNDDKIELTEKLTSEQKNNKELFEKLQKTEIHLQTLADAIEIKDKELSNLRESSNELNRQVIQSEHLTDRLRHYEAQDHSTPALQHELQESKQIIAKLLEEINQLKERKENETISDNNIETKNDSDTELRRRLENLELRNKELEAQLLNEKTITDTNHNDQVLDKESAMKHLETKFLKTMEDIANLTEEKQRLEHLVLQLQGETETIGEYVALYQHQRSVLKQKAIEKDQQLTQLANDREHMKEKLEKLNDLVVKLVLEKGAIPSELLEHQKKFNNDNHLCEEHAKINSEINKIAQNSYTIEPNSENPEGAQTAEQIIELLSEIKTSNLIQPSENFHHCPWCSGQLITV